MEKTVKKNRMFEARNHAVYKKTYFDEYQFYR